MSELGSHETDTPTLIAAMRVLAAGIDSVDGVATTAIAEAGQRLEELSTLARDLVPYMRHMVGLPEGCPACKLAERYRRLVLAKGEKG